MRREDGREDGREWGDGKHYARSCGLVMLFGGGGLVALFFAWLYVVNQYSSQWTG